MIIIILLLLSLLQGRYNCYANTSSNNNNINLCICYVMRRIYNTCISRCTYTFSTYMYIYTCIYFKQNIFTILIINIIVILYMHNVYTRICKDECILVYMYIHTCTIYIYKFWLYAKHIDEYSLYIDIRITVAPSLNCCKKKMPQCAKYCWI